MRRALTFLGIMLAGALFTHVAFSAAVSAWIADRYHHRLFNVRNIADQSLYAPLAQLFLDTQILNDPRPKILFFGSSFTWGYSWPENVIFSAEMQNDFEDYQLVNLSVIGQGLEATISFLCQVAASGDSVPTSIIEVNIFNIESDPETLSGYHGCHSATSQYNAFDAPFSYLHFVVQYPWGFGYFESFWDEYNYPQSEATYSFATLPESYFPSYGDILQGRSIIGNMIADGVALSDQFSESVILFTPPTLQQGLISSQYPEQTIETIDQLVNEMCQQSGAALCLTAGIWSDPLQFSNLTHLNISGHQTFSRWLSPTLSAVVQ